MTCQHIIYLQTTFGKIRVYAPEIVLRDSLGKRETVDFIRVIVVPERTSDSREMLVGHRSKTKLNDHFVYSVPNIDPEFSGIRDLFATIFRVDRSVQFC